MNVSTFCKKMNCKHFKKCSKKELEQDKWLYKCSIIDERWNDHFYLDMLVKSDSAFFEDYNKCPYFDKAVVILELENL